VLVLRESRVNLYSCKNANFIAHPGFHGLR
jgi:hypothetical protein